MNRPEEGKSVSSNQSTKVIRLRHNYLALTNKLSIVNQQRLFFKKNFKITISFSKGCQIVYFRTKNPNLGTFWRALELKMLIYFMIVENI
jgi:hypothetical protein